MKEYNTRKIDKNKYEEARELVLQRVTLVQYFSDYVDSNANLDYERRQPCPVHGEDIPSFTYYHGTDTWHCFGCKGGGDVIRLHQLLLQNERNHILGYSQGLLDLARLYSIEIPDFYDTTPTKRMEFKSRNFDIPIITKGTETNGDVTKGSNPNRHAVEPMVALSNRLETTLRALKRTDIEEYIKIVNFKDYVVAMELNEEQTREIFNELFTNISKIQASKNG